MRSALSRGLQGGAIDAPLKTIKAAPGKPKGKTKGEKGDKKKNDAARTRATSEPPGGESKGSKGRVCHFYLKGTCRNGASCPFSHTDGPAAPSGEKKKEDRSVFILPERHLPVRRRLHEAAHRKKASQFVTQRRKGQRQS